MSNAFRIRRHVAWAVVAIAITSCNGVGNPFAPPKLISCDIGQTSDELRMRLQRFATTNGFEYIEFDSGLRDDSLLIMMAREPGQTISLVPFGFSQIQVYSRIHFAVEVSEEERKQFIRDADRATAIIEQACRS